MKPSLKIASYLWPIFLFLLISTAEAQTCRYEPRSLDVSLELAPVVFIGHVVQVGGKRVRFSIEKGIKGVGRRKTFSVLEGKTACHIKFKPGSFWLYLGEQLQHGSMLLVDDLGRPIEPAASMVKESFGYDLYAIKPAVFQAIAVDACAPWDGAAFYIRLKHGLTAHVYASLDKYEGSQDVVTFKTGSEKAGGAVIYLCDKDGKNCGGRLKGSISITGVTKTSVNGYIEVLDSVAGSIGRYIFEAERLPEAALCG